VPDEGQLIRMLVPAAVSLTSTSSASPAMTAMPNPGGRLVPSPVPPPLPPGPVPGAPAADPLPAAEARAAGYR
jgi:hypothetical protein